MEFRTALGKAIGLGSAHTGSGHWWMQRLTAIALIPLSLWMIWFLNRLVALDHTAMSTWVAHPWNSTFLLAYVCAACYHAQLGLKEVIVDYVHHTAARVCSLIVIWLGLLFLLLLAFASIVRIIANG